MEPFVTAKWFVLNFLPCPSCNSKLVPKEGEHWWNNVYCTFCDFTCRFVVVPNTPEDSVLAIRKAELEDLLQLKKSLPPLMLHYKWESSGIPKERVVYMPFIAYRFLKEKHMHPIGLTPEEIPEVEVYSNIFEIPNITIYESPSDEEIAEIVTSWPQPIRASQIQMHYDTGYVRAARIADLAKARLLSLGRLVPDDEDDESF